MKLKVTINMGSYGDIGLESNEYYTIEECVDELDRALGTLEHPLVDDFRKKILKTEVE